MLRDEFKYPRSEERIQSFRAFVLEKYREWEKVFNLEILRYLVLLFIFGLVYF